MVRVEYSTINYKDALAATGAGRILRKYPLVGGIDLAGTVVGSRDPRYTSGQHVLVTGCGLSETHDGGYAEYARLVGDWVIPSDDGEVLFMGASGSKRGDDEWEITFRFAASPNVTNLTIGDITGVDKKGWEYLWVRYADAEDEKVLVKQPTAVYVEKVYESGNFAGLGIGV